MLRAETKNSPLSSLKKNCLRWRQYLFLFCLNACFCPVQMTLSNVHVLIKDFCFQFLLQFCLSAFLLLQLRRHTLHSFLLCLKYHFTSACPIGVQLCCMSYAHFEMFRSLIFISILVKFCTSCLSAEKAFQRFFPTFLLSYFPTR